jgi:hypothetical protein
MSVQAVEFRGDNRPVRDDSPRSEIDRSAEAMRRLRHPFDTPAPARYTGAV